MKKDLLISTVLILIGLFSRLIVHDWNFTAMGAISILSGLWISNKYLKFAVPLLVMIISDIVIGFHDTVLFVYLGFTLMTLISTVFKDSKTIQKLFFAPLASSLVFFFVSNLGVWIIGRLYVRNLSGLMECMMMGVPFYRSQFLADMILTPIFYFSLSYLFVHLLNFSFLSQTERA